MISALKLSATQLPASFQERMPFAEEHIHCIYMSLPVKLPFSLVMAKYSTQKTKKQALWGTVGEFELESGTRDGDRTRTPCGKQILSLLRLPFRHPGTGNMCMS